MTPTELEQTRIVAESAIEIVQDCRKALGLEKGELLTVAVTRLADDRERLLARVAEYEATGVKLCKQVVDLTSALDKAQRERDAVTWKLTCARTALENWGNHFKRCEKAIEPWKACTCGYDAEIAAAVISANTFTPQTSAASQSTSGVKE
jgi:hypothetical protein